MGISLTKTPLAFNFRGLLRFYIAITILSIVHWKNTQINNNNACILIFVNHNWFPLRRDFWSRLKVITVFFYWKWLPFPNRRPGNSNHFSQNAVIINYMPYHAQKNPYLTLMAHTSYVVLEKTEVTPTRIMDGQPWLLGKTEPLSKTGMSGTLGPRAAITHTFRRFLPNLLIDVPIFLGRV